MLYLNTRNSSHSSGFLDLTLTSVVFEFGKSLKVLYLSSNLTLTSVVFEFMITIIIKKFFFI